MRRLDQTEWTEDEIERLKALRAQGLSYSKIGKQLRTRSRNMVAGKLKRLRDKAKPAAPNVVPMRTRRHG